MTEAETSYDPAAEVVELCRELIRIDTTQLRTAAGAGERKAAEYVAGLLDEVGIGSELFESEPGRTSLVADWAPGRVDPDASPLLIHGHLDVVPANAADWANLPFEGEVADGCVWGRGAVDMKDMDAMVLSCGSGPRPGRDRAAPPDPAGLPADEEAGSGLGATWLVEEPSRAVRRLRGGRSARSAGSR